MYLKVGDFVRIKRNWMHHPSTDIQGIVLEIRKTRADSDYRFIKLLKLCGNISDEPVKLGHYGTDLEIISRNHECIFFTDHGNINKCRGS